MTCLHGMDEVNCPICRISNVSIPKNTITQIKSKQENFLIKSPFLEKITSRKEEYEREINIKTNVLKPNLINPLPTPNLISQIPPFENKTLLEQLNKQDLDKIDAHGITKKIPIKKGELEFK